MAHQRYLFQHIRGSHTFSAEILPPGVLWDDAGCLPIRVVDAMGTENIQKSSGSLFCLFPSYKLKFYLRKPVDLLSTSPNSAMHFHSQAYILAFIIGRYQPPTLLL